jgi:hypothetical protein
MYVSKDKSNGIMFYLLVNTRVSITATALPIQLAGLDAAKKYCVKEINYILEQNLRLMKA